MKIEIGSARLGRAIPARVSTRPRFVVTTNCGTNVAVYGTMSAAMTAPKAMRLPAKSNLASAYPAADAATMFPATTIAATTTLFTR
jgi:hypothetical protein